MSDDVVSPTTDKILTNGKVNFEIAKGCISVVFCDQNGSIRAVDFACTFPFDGLPLEQRTWVQKTSTYEMPAVFDSIFGDVMLKASKAQAGTCFSGWSA